MRNAQLPSTHTWRRAMRRHHVFSVCPRDGVTERERAPSARRLGARDRPIARTLIHPKESVHMDTVDRIADRTVSYGVLTFAALLIVAAVMVLA